MLPRKNFFAFNSCQIFLITFKLVSIASQTINLDGDLTGNSSSTFVYYETTTQLNDDLVNTLDHNLTNLNDLPPTSTINPEQFTNSSGFGTENATKTIDYLETIKPDNSDNQKELPVDHVDLLTTIKPDDNKQSTPLLIPLIEELLFEEFNNQPDKSTSESIELTSKQSTDYEPTAQPEVTINNLYSNLDDQGPTTTESNQAKTTITSTAETKLPLTPQSTAIYSIATQSSTPSIVTNNPEVSTTTNDVETIKLITGQEMISTTTEKVNSESTQQSTSLPVTIKPSLATTMVDDVETRQSTIDLPITTESNLNSTIQGKSTTPLYSEITTITSESNQPTTFKTITESSQSSQNNEVSSTIIYNHEPTTITTTDWVQSTTTSDSKSDDNTTPTISFQFPTSIATESSFATETIAETIQSTTLQTQTEPQFTTTFKPEVETTTEGFTAPFRPTIETTTNRPTIETTTTTRPEVETTTESFTAPFRPTIETTTTTRPEVETTTEQITTRTEPQLTTTTIKPEITTEHFITTIKPEIETTTPSTIMITTNPDEPATESNISCDCDKSNFDDKPHCKFTCASSTFLAGIHINLTLFGIKLATILSNRDYVICIATGLGCLLLISGIVLRLIHNRKQRKLIAQRNFEILYQDFGTINEKNKQWLADFSYQSSIL